MPLIPVTNGSYSINSIVPPSQPPLQTESLHIHPISYGYDSRYVVDGVQRSTHYTCPIFIPLHHHIDYYSTLVRWIMIPYFLCTILRRGCLHYFIYVCAHFDVTRSEALYEKLSWISDLSDQLWSTRYDWQITYSTLLSHFLAQTPQVL